MIEKHFDIPFIADLALREKQIQQNYRPIIAVHKWFARRPGTLFRGLLLSEFEAGDLSSNYFKPHDLHGLRIADPFMGGGTPLIEANRLGCDVVGCDINPMAYWIVRQELEHLDLGAYRAAAAAIQQKLEAKIGPLYRTTCRICGADDAHVKYFLWVKTRRCDACGHEFDLIPGYLLAENIRHPQNVIICRSCGELSEVQDRRQPGACEPCGMELAIRGPASHNQCICPSCGVSNSYASGADGPLSHRMLAIEYYCARCKASHTGRFFKKPDADDLVKAEQADSMLKSLGPSFIPDDTIPPGDETDRLHRWGYRRYREMFNSRQLLGLELLCRAIAGIADERVRNALATNLSDLLRYQNMLCRYDTMALKSLDIFSVHGFPVGLVPCESNFIGIVNGGGANVGSGGWANIVEKFAKAKSYCDQPFEIRHEGGRKKVIPVAGEWIGDRREGSLRQRRIDLRCASSTELDLPPASLDAVVTDPPY
ncbi:MAG: DNA methylase, partial [Patescibacteria group bacterium]